MISRFPAYLSDPGLQPAPLGVLTPLLNHSRPAVRKRAITTLAQFLPLSQSESNLVKTTILPALASGTRAEQQRTVVQLVAAVARHSPHHIAPYMKDIVTGVLSAVSKDDEELKDGSLQALEALVLRCPTEIAGYLDSLIATGKEYIKYDPVSLHLTFNFVF